MIDHTKAYNKFLNQFINKWLNCMEEFPANKPKFSFIEKYIWELKCERFLSFVKSNSEKRTSKMNCFLKSANPSLKRSYRTPMINYN